MPAPCQSRFPGEIDQLLVKPLSSRKMQRLRTHLTGCPTCQQRYNKVVLASRLLEGGPQSITVPSSGELARVGEEVMRRVRLVPDAAPARRPLTTWLAAAATFGVVLAIALPVALQKVRRPAGSSTGVVNEHAASGSSTGTVDEYQFHPRGGTASGLALGLRGFCIAQATGLPPSVTSLTSAADETGTCRVEDALKFAYTNRSQLPYLFLVGVDEKYSIKWYEPHPPQRQSVRVKNNVTDEPLQRAVRLSVNHRPGQLRVYALFSATPLSADAVELAVSKASQRRMPIERLTSLPVADCLQHSLLIRLRP